MPKNQNWFAFAILFGVLCFVPYTMVAQTSENRGRVVSSLTEWVEEVNNWPEEEYKAWDLTIELDPVKDSLYFKPSDQIEYSDIDVPPLVVNKSIQLWGVEFKYENTSNSKVLQNITFAGQVRIYWLENHRLILHKVNFERYFQLRLIRTLFSLYFEDCRFKSFVNFNNFEERVHVMFGRCFFEGRFNYTSARNATTLEMDSCSMDWFDTNQNSMESMRFTNCAFRKGFWLDECRIENSFNYENNTTGQFCIEGTVLPEYNSYIPFHTVTSKFAMLKRNWVDDEIASYRAETDAELRDEANFNKLVAAYAKLLGIYRARSDLDSYNACYVEMRDLKTRQSKLRYNDDPSFANLTVYQLNLFLKTFSDYGTRPTKAIIFSVYVILIFAAVYLLFPNHWDKHGKNRIVHRYSFFLKYMNQKEGAHEVFLDERKSEIMAYDEFRQLITSTDKSVPPFFKALGLPLFRWATGGTRIAAKFLNAVDVMDGTWSDLPPRRKWWQGVVLSMAFLLTMIYDIAIKMLNALMLSINTFTTLGFGEIPLRGLPRYLAIIQGFVGWFMLTIFSVSLISQLLN